MNYFLAKTESGAFSIDNLEKDGTTTWNGVHSYEAINCIKTWNIGDYVFIYHSTGESAIAGLAEVISTPIKDADDERGISWVATVKHVKTYPKEKRITLKQIKESGLFANFKLVKQSRLSVMLCPKEFVEWVCQRVNTF
jgi:predicted RNA-binding protein with PUA-like domain